MRKSKPLGKKEIPSLQSNHSVYLARSEAITEESINNENEVQPMENEELIKIKEESIKGICNIFGNPIVFKYASIVKSTWNIPQFQHVAVLNL